MRLISKLDFRSLPVNKRIEIYFYNLKSLECDKNLNFFSHSCNIHVRMKDSNLIFLIIF